MSTFTPEVEKLATDWFRRCRESQKVHYDYASLLEKRHLCFGVPAIALSAIVGTAVFSTWGTSSKFEWIRILFGLLSMLVSAITALQTFLNLSDRAAKHKIAGASYGAIRRELELLKTLPPKKEDEMYDAIRTIKSKMDELAENSPGIPSNFKKKIDEKLKSKSHRRIYQLSSD